MYTHTVRRQEGGEVVETRTNVSRHIYDQLLSQVIISYNQQFTRNEESQFIRLREILLDLISRLTEIATSR